MAATTTGCGGMWSLMRKSKRLSCTEKPRTCPNGLTTMTSGTPFTKNEGSRRAALGWRMSGSLAVMIFAAGCAHDAVDDAAWQASRVGTAVGDHQEITQISGLEAGSRIV